MIQSQPFNRIFALVFVPTVVGAIGLLVMGIWPGLIGTALFPFFLGAFVVLALAGWVLLVAFLTTMDYVNQRLRLGRPRWGTWSAAVMLGVVTLLALHIPQRCAFAFSQSRLTTLAKRA
ncbi:MAG: hypothetical protein AAGJ46_20505 [Planctomycetota bacterium]